MKIFYAVQATGNGHISRAMELMPYLQAYGIVDVFLSGSNASLPADLPVRYRNNGLSLHYTSNGALDLFKTARNIDLFNVLKTARHLPLEQYDLVINDFEAITSLACRLQKRSSVHFGHQASFASPNTPRPRKKSWSGEFILKNFAIGSTTVGLHFEAYDDFILPPVIKTGIWKATARNENYVTVYLPSFSNAILLKYLGQIPEQAFQVFSKEQKNIVSVNNCQLIPIGKESFNKSLINCTGIITNAGFETPAEAIYLKKKILAVPISGQYEQACNASALERSGATVLEKVTAGFSGQIRSWLHKDAPKYDGVKFWRTDIIVEKMMEMALAKEVYKTN